MSRGTIGLRAVLAATLMLGLGSAAHAVPPRQDPGACKGQPEIKPLQPLSVTTGKGTFKFTVELADSNQEREFGLMCRKSLAADRGMLFQFAKPDYQAFWMRNTLIPLDMIFIGADRRIAGVVENAAPETETETGRSVDGESQYVLEIGGGLSQKWGISAGSTVEFQGLPASAIPN